MRPITRNVRCGIFILCAVAAFAHSAAGEAAIWKIVQNAFLRINDEGVKDWSMFQIDKKKDDRLLLQIGDRFLLVDGQQRQLFDLASASVERSGADIMWDPANKPAKPLATSGWLVRDVGYAQRIKVKLDAENRTLDLQIPHKFTHP